MYVFNAMTPFDFEREWENESERIRARECQRERGTYLAGFCFPAGGPPASRGPPRRRSSSWSSRCPGTAPLSGSTPAPSAPPRASASTQTTPALMLTWCLLTSLVYWVVEEAHSDLNKPLFKNILECDIGCMSKLKKKNVLQNKYVCQGTSLLDTWLLDSVIDNDIIF